MDRFSSRKQHLIVPGMNFPYILQNCFCRSLMTSQIRSKVRSLSIRHRRLHRAKWPHQVEANKMKWQWIVSGMLQSIIQSLWPPLVKSMSSQVTRSKMSKSVGLGVAIHVFRSGFRKEHEKWPLNTFWTNQTGKKWKIARMLKSPVNAWNDRYDIHYCKTRRFARYILKFCTLIHRQVFFQYTCSGLWKLKKQSIVEKYKIIFTIF